MIHWLRNKMTIIITTIKTKDPGVIGFDKKGEDGVILKRLRVPAPMFFIILLFILFIPMGLKIAGLISISWLWATATFWMLVATIIIIVGSFLLAVFITTLIISMLSKFFKD